MQPDRRIRRHELRQWSFGDKRYIVNGRRGVPRNATIEEFDGALRCSSSHAWLDDEAAEYVRTVAEKSKGNTFYVK
jgi:hypothetical protein